VPLVQTLGGEVVTGEDMPGEQISVEVQRRIEASDGLIAFRTRRGDPNAAGVYGTHRWVEDELALAVGHGLKVLEIREQGVDEQGGLAGDRQWLRYDEAARDRFLVELAKAVGAWMRNVTVSLQLLPPEFVDEIRPLLLAPGFRCSYKLLEGSRESDWQPAQVRPIKGGLFVQALGISSEALIQISVEGNGKRWSSDFETMDSVGILLTAG